MQRAALATVHAEGSREHSRQTFLSREWGAAVCHGCGHGTSSCSLPVGPTRLSFACLHSTQVFQGKTIKVPVCQGPEGVAEFKRTVCKLFNLPEGTDFEVTFECKSPVFGEWPETASPATSERSRSTSALQALWQREVYSSLFS